MKRRKRFLSIVLTVMMVMSTFTGMTFTASANDVSEDISTITNENAGNSQENQSVDTKDTGNSQENQSAGKKDTDNPSSKADISDKSAESLEKNSVIPENKNSNIISEEKVEANATIKDRAAQLSSSSPQGTPWNGKSDKSWYKEDTDSFTITTAEQLAGLAELVNDGNKFENKTIKLGADIYLNSDEKKNEHDWMPIGRIRAKRSESGAGKGFPMMLPFENQNPFYGTLDGNEHTIHNLFVTGKDPSEGDIKGVGNALIGYNCGTVKNLAVTGSVSGTRRSAGIVGFNGKSGVIEGCEANVTVEGNGNGSNRGTGGIAGTNQGKIMYCANRGKIHNYGMTGGIAGMNDGGTVQYCCNIGLVESDQLMRAGGVVGGNGTELSTEGSIVTDCYYLVSSCNKGTGGSKYDTVVSQTKAFTQGGRIIGESETLFDSLEKACPEKFKKSKKDGMPTLPWLDAEDIGNQDPNISDVNYEINLEKPEGGELRVLVNGMTVEAPSKFNVKEGTELQITASLTNDSNKYKMTSPNITLTAETGGVHEINKHPDFSPYIFNYKVSPVLKKGEVYDGKGQKLTIRATYDEIKQDPIYVLPEAEYIIPKGKFIVGAEDNFYENINLDSIELNKLDSKKVELNYNTLVSKMNESTISIKNKKFKIRGIKLSELLKEYRNIEDFSSIYALINYKNVQTKWNKNLKKSEIISKKPDIRAIEYNSNKVKFDSSIIVSSFIDEDGNDYVKNGTFKILTNSIGGISDIKLSNEEVSGIYGLGSRFCINVHTAYLPKSNIGINEKSLNSEMIEIKDDKGKHYAVKGISIKNFLNSQMQYKVMELFPKSIIFKKIDGSEIEENSLKYGSLDNIYIALSMKEKINDSKLGDELVNSNTISVVKDGGELWKNDVKELTFTRSDFAVDNSFFAFEQLQQLAESREVLIEGEKYKVIGVSMKKIMDTYLKLPDITSFKLFAYRGDDEPKILNSRDVDLKDVFIAWSQNDSNGKNVIPENLNGGINFRAVYKSGKDIFKAVDVQLITTEAADFTYDGRGMSIAELKAKSDAVTTDANFVMKKKGNSHSKKVTGITLENLKKYFNMDLPAELTAADDKGYSATVKLLEYPADKIMLCWNEDGHDLNKIRLAVDGAPGKVWVSNVKTVKGKYPVKFKLTPSNAKVSVTDSENGNAPVNAEADGSFFLEKNHKYRYVVSAEGYKPQADNMEITSAVADITVALSLISSGGSSGGSGGSTGGDKIVLKIYTQEGASGTKKLAASFTEKELNGLMTTNSSGYVYQYYKNNTWFGVVATGVVSFEHLLGTAGINFSSKDSMRQDAPDGFSTTKTYDQIAEAKYFYDVSNNNKRMDVPAGLAMWWTSGNIENGYADLANKANELGFTGKLRYVMGVSESAFENKARNGVGGFRLGTGIDSITIIQNEQISETTGRIKGRNSHDTNMPDNKKSEEVKPVKPQDSIKPDKINEISSVTGVNAPASKVFKDVVKGSWYESAVGTMLSKGIMNGISSNNFAPTTNVTRAQFVTILYRLKGSPKISAKSSFADVNANSWYATAVVWAGENGVITGSNGKFAPNDNASREQLVMMIYRFVGSPKVDDKMNLGSFKDSSQVSTYAKDAMRWAVSKGIINGMGNGNLSPKSTATRAQIAAITERLMKIQGLL